jgi:hypothetical protein
MKSVYAGRSRDDMQAVEYIRKAGARVEAVGFGVAAAYDDADARAIERFLIRKGYRWVFVDDAANRIQPNPGQSKAERLLLQLIDSVFQYHATSRCPDSTRIYRTAQRIHAELGRPGLEGRPSGNPDLAVVSLGMNPPGEVFGSDVLAIVYQHEGDRTGDVRVHLFGKGGAWRETRGGRGVEVYNLPNVTGVYMMAEGEKRVVMQHRRGLPLVRDF